MLQNILAAIPPRVFYETVLRQTLPEENEKGDVFIQCPFHERFSGKSDERASLSVSLLPDRAGVFQCFGCKASGNVIRFFQLLHNIDDQPVRVALERMVELFELDPSLLRRELIDEETLLDWSNALFNTPEGKKLVEHLVHNRFINKDVIVEHRLGLHHNGRLAIPIFDADNAIVNVRQWLPEYKRKTDRDHRQKMLGIPGANNPRPYPYYALRRQDIILCEGELDCLALKSLGFNALTNAAGVADWPLAWTQYFADKNVTILFDAGGSAVEQADTMLLRIAEVARHVKVIHLKPEIDPNDFDVTDLIRDVGKDQAGAVLRQMMDNTPWFYETTKMDKTYIKVNLYSGANADVINKNIEMQARVGGKETDPFAIPEQVTCQCMAERPNKRCPGCPLLQSSEDTITKTIDKDSGTVLELLQSGKEQSMVLKRMFGVGCTTCRFKIDKYTNVEEIRLIPEIDMNAATHEHVIRNCFYAGYGLQMNHSYTLHGRTVLDPVSQRVTHVFDKATPVDNFSTTVHGTDKVTIDGHEDTVYNHLKKFQPAHGQEIREKLYEIYLDFEVNVVRIWNRKDLIQAYDLTYHSPIHFNFGDEYVHQGWLSTLVVGDTQCGKTKTLVNLQKHFNAGVVLSGEAISRVGLMGGFIEVPGRRGSKYMLGQFPLNDGRLVAIDEFSGMKPEEIGELTLMRSYGKTIVTKQAQHYEFPARVRTIMLSNPRDGRAMSSFGQGVIAVAKLIGTDADTARFDIFCAVATDEVPLDEINSITQQDTPHHYTSELCNLMVNWAWTRKATDYEFTTEAQQQIFSFATKMAEQYDPSIPIVVAGSHRWTIARVAAAIATRLFSTDESGRRVIIRREHVEAAVTFLYNCYNKPSMGYHVYSARRRREQHLENPATIEAWLRQWPWQVADQLHQLGRFTKTELANVTGLDDFTTKDIVSKLVQVGALRSQNNQFYLNTGFRKLLEQFEHPDYGNVQKIIGDTLEGDAVPPNISKEI